jgi:DNA-directed RNA polymerase subunit RPC12/RpoP
MTTQQNSIVSPIKCPRCGAILDHTGDPFECPYCHARFILRVCQNVIDTPQQNQSVVAMQPFDLPDPQAGVPVLHMQIPAGWSWTGGAQWTSNPVQAARVHFMIQDPQGIAALEGLPTDYFGWTSDQNMQNRISPGGNYYGTEFQPPATAMQALQYFVLPRYRPIPGLQIIAREPVEELIQDISCSLKARGDTSMVDAFRVQLCYSLDHTPLFEHLEGIVLTSRKLSPGMYGTVEHINWCTNRLYACRARQDQFGKWAPVFRQMIDSIQINPHWHTYYQQTAQRLSQQAQLQIRQAFDKKQHQSAEDGDLRGEHPRARPTAELINDPAENIEVELSYPYKQVWSNGSGEYILSDDLAYNPNANEVGIWSQIDPAK